MARAIPLLFVAAIALVAVALISCLSADEDEIATMPRSAWVFVILVFPIVGAIVWFLSGRAHAGEVASGHPRGLLGSLPLMARRRQMVAPDDNPEFLRSLDVELARRDRELFRHWEDDLARADDDRERGTEKAGEADGTETAGGAGTAPP